MADLTPQQVTELLENHVFSGYVEPRENYRGETIPGYTWEDQGWEMWTTTGVPSGVAIPVEGLGLVRLIDDYYETGDYSGEMSKIFQVESEDGTKTYYCLEGTWRSYDGSEWNDHVFEVNQQPVTKIEWVAV